jgi:transcriptional regulator with XRE-family HTH domain
MNFSAAFDLTLKEFGLTGKSIATKAGLREATVSNFRNGGDIRKESLEKLIEALPADAKQYLFLKVFVGDLNPQGIATLLSLLAGRLKDVDTETQDNIEGSVISRSPVSA